MLKKAMRRDDKATSDGGTHFRAQTIAARHAPRPDTVHDMDRSGSGRGPYCPFRNCTKHRSCHHNQYANFPQMFRDDEARAAHLSLFHMEALVEADPDDLASQSIFVCPNCEQHAFCSLESLHRHSNACATASDEDEMEVEHADSDSDESSPYNESQDVDFYTHVRAQCPPAHKNDLEEMIRTHATHGTILERIFAWTTASKPNHE